MLKLGKIRTSFPLVVRSIGPYLALTALAAVSLRTLLLVEGTIAVEDMVFPITLDGAYRSLYGANFVWNDHSNFGTFDPYSLPSRVFWSIITVIMLAVGPERAVEFLVEMVLLSVGFLMYYSIRQLKFGVLSSFVAATFYMLNPWVFGRLAMGHLFIVFSYALLPLVVSLMWLAAAKNSLRFAVASAWTAVLINYFSSHFFYFGVIIVSILLLIALVQQVSFRHVIRVGGAWFAVVALLTSYFLFVFSDITQAYVTAEFGPNFLGLLEIQSQRASLANVLTLDSYPVTWFQNALNNPWIFSAYIGFVLLVPTFGAIMSLSNRNESRGILGSLMVLVFLLATVFATGTGSVFAGFNYWAFTTIPGFVGLVELNKFVGLISFTYSYFIGLVARVQAGSSAIGRSAIPIILLATILGTAQPFFTGDMSGYLAPSKVPDCYRGLDTITRESPGDYRVFLPKEEHPRIRYDWMKKDAEDPLALFLSKNTMSRQLRQSPDEVRLFRLIDYSVSLGLPVSDLLGIYSVRYVVVRHDVEIPEAFRRIADNIPWSLLGKQYFSNFEQVLSNDDSFRLVFKCGPVSMFENMHYRARIYGSDKVLSIIGPYRGLISLQSLGLLREIVVDFIPQIDMSEATSNLLVFNSDLFFSEVSTLGQSVRLAKLVSPVTSDMREAWATGEYDWRWNVPYLGGSDDSLIALMGLEKQNLIATIAGASVRAQFSVNYPDSYSIFMPIVYGDSRGRITVSLDGEEIFSSVTTNPFLSNPLTLLGTFELESGTHELQFLNIPNVNGTVNLIGDPIVIPQNTVNDLESGTLSPRVRNWIYLHEAESMLWEKATLVRSSDYSAGLAVKTTNGSMASKTFTLPDSRPIEIFVRAAGLDDNAHLNVLVDGVPTADILMQGGQAWYSVSPLNLGKGRHELTVVSRNSSFIDILGLEPSGNITGQGRVTRLAELNELQPMALANHNVKSASYIPINPTRYSLTGLNTTFVVFTDNFAPGWRLDAPVGEFQSRPIDMVVPLHQFSVSDWSSSNLDSAFLVFPRQDFLSPAATFGQAGFLAIFVGLVVYTARRKFGHRWRLSIRWRTRGE